MKGFPIEAINVSAYSIPTDFPEADGTFSWSKTTMVVAEVEAGGKTGIGFTYADTSTARLIQDVLIPVIKGRDAMDMPGAWSAMVYSIRNLGRPGIVSMRISAVDSALWDLKSKILNLPLVSLLGSVRDRIPVYGSGGFTSYSIEQLQEQLGNWVQSGIGRVKMKIGTHPQDDLARVRAAREAIRSRAELFVDANGAYTRKQALEFAEAFSDLCVKWFEEPVSSDDLEGLRVIQAANLCQATPIPLSAHTAPSIHAHPSCDLNPVCHIEELDIITYDGVRLRRVLLPAVREADKDTLIIANGFSCREQIAQTTDRRALHLSQVIRIAMREGPRGPGIPYPEKNHQWAKEKKEISARETAILVGAGVVLAGAAWMLLGNTKKR